jgi:hypothetical protein
MDASDEMELVNDGLAYNDARWTDASESGRTNLHSNSYGSYAKDAAFYYYATAVKDKN